MFFRVADGSVVVAGDPPGCKVDDFPSWGIPKDVLMCRGVPEMNAQENWLSGIHKLIQGVLCRLDRESPFFNDVQLVCSYFVSCAA